MIHVLAIWDLVKNFQFSFRVVKVTLNFFKRKSLKRAWVFASDDITPSRAHLRLPHQPVAEKIVHLQQPSEPKLVAVWITGSSS